MAKYDVHVYVVVRVLVWNVEAETPKEATDKACEELGPQLYDMFPDRTSKCSSRPVSELAIESGGYAEDIDGFLVDVVGDFDYGNSVWLNGHGEKETPSLVAGGVAILPE